MKIAIDVSQICFPGTGVAKYTASLVNELVKHDKHQFLLFGYSWGRRKLFGSFFKNYAPLPNVTTKLIAWPNSVVNWWGNAWHKINLEDLIGKFDVLHTSDWVEFPSRNIKVTTIHDLVVYRYPEHLDIRIIKTQKQKLSWVAKESRMIFADSQATKDDILTFLSISEQKIRVVHLGVGEQFYKRTNSEINLVKTKYDLADNYLLFVGTREPRKNLQRLIEALALISKLDLSLVIVGGKGWGEDLLTNKNIKVLNFVGDEDLPVLYSGAQVFVYPSLYEGFGLPVLEAMRCEVPVVTSNQGSLAEIAGLGTITVDPNNIEAISTGIKEAVNLTGAKKKLMLESNLERAKKFTWEKTAAAVMAGYESLI